MFRLLTSVAVVLLFNAWGSAQAYQFAFDEKIAIDAHPDIKTDLGRSDTRKVHVFDLGHLSGPSLEEGRGVSSVSSLGSGGCYLVKGRGS